MSRTLKIVLGWIGLLVVALLAWVFVLSPIRSDIADTEALIEKTEERLAVAQTRLTQAEVMKEEGQRNQARLVELAKMVPETEEIPSLLLQIQDLADQSGIHFDSIAPGQVVDSEYLSARILPLEVEFTGKFFDVSDFVYRAEQMAGGPGRLLAIKSLTMDLASGAEEPVPGVSPDLKVKMTIYAFLYGGEARSTASTSARETRQTVEETTPLPQ